MAEEKKEKADGAQAAEPKKRDVKLLLYAVLGVFNLVVGGGATFFVYKSTLGFQKPSITEEKLDQASLDVINKLSEETGGFIYTMDKFTVNLTGNPKRTIRIEVNLDMLGKDGFEEVIDPDRRAIAKDKVLRILNQKTFSELETIQGKLQLKNSIALEVNSILNKGTVKDVYFTDFVVQ